MFASKLGVKLDDPCVITLFSQRQFASASMLTMELKKVWLKNLFDALLFRISQFVSEPAFLSTKTSRCHRLQFSPGPFFNFVQFEEFRPKTPTKLLPFLPSNGLYCDSE